MNFENADNLQFSRDFGCSFPNFFCLTRFLLRFQINLYITSFKTFSFQFSFHLVFEKCFNKALVFLYIENTNVHIYKSLFKNSFISIFKKSYSVLSLYEYTFSSCISLAFYLELPFS